ncbi:hypothetical protein DV532_26820 (plasmid) [Pseudomonas sp. Leaf58]|nr:hypothetical protein DV532_26820 [Pseudomonas sp. Leaf58]
MRRKIVIVGHFRHLEHLEIHTCQLFTVRELEHFTRQALLMASKLKIMCLLTLLKGFRLARLALFGNKHCHACAESSIEAWFGSWLGHDVLRRPGIFQGRVLSIMG